MNNKKIAIYLRVSTKEQSTDLQRAEIETYLKARGWNSLQVFEDKASGTNTNRPALKALLSECRLGKFDLIICWKLDRFARSLSDLIKTLQELSERNIEFISIKDQIDLTTSAGKLMLHILGAFANFEADLIKERVNAGIANAKAKGTRFGRPQTINAAKVIELRNNGWSLGKIAKYLSISKAGVHKTLKQNSSTNVFNNSENIEFNNSFKNLKVGERL